MRRVLIAWEFGGGLGHLTRLRPLAAALLEAGCAVTLAVRDVEAGRRVFAALRQGPGEIDIRAAPHLRPRPAPETTTHTLADVMMRAGLADRDSVFAAADWWFRLIESLAPALIIADFSPLCRFVARGRVPVVTVGNGYTIPPPGPCPPIRPWQDAVETRAAEEAILATINFLARVNRIPRVGAFHELLRGEATFVCTAAELDPYARRRAEPVWPAYNIDEIDAAPSWNARDHRAAVIYVPGDHPRRADLEAALLEGSLQGHGYTPDRPLHSAATGTGIAWSGAPLPFGQLLPRARVTIHHGGLGIAQEALLAATPQIVLPTQLEHHVTATALKGLGVGEGFMTHEPILVSQLVRAIHETIESDATARAAARWAAVLRARGSGKHTLGCVLDACAGLADGALALSSGESSPQKK